MSDADGEEENGKAFLIDIAKQGRATCKKCKQKCPTGELRIAKLLPNAFGSGLMKSWHHVDCIFQQFLTQRITTKRIESTYDLDGWEALNENDRKVIIDKIKESNEYFEVKHGTKASLNKPVITSLKSPSKDVTPVASSSGASNSRIQTDDLFKEFRRLVADISNVNSYIDKTKLVRKMFMEGSDGCGFKSDISLWCKLLLPGIGKRTYNLQNKQLIKLFSKIFDANQNDMLEHFEQGDIGETIQQFFEKSRKVQPCIKSKLTVKEVDDFLEELSKLTKEEEQINHIKDLISKCTSNDLKVIVRLIKCDLRMNAGAKHILQGVHRDAYEVYQSSRDLDIVMSKCLGGNNKVTGNEKTVKAKVSLMVPLLPMLAEACKSIDDAMNKFPNGMYSEVKYDGERVQVHKKGTEYKYFSRSLKPVLAHKVAHLKDYVAQAFPHGRDLILDSEILMIDTNTGKPLPFGSLGKHKKNEFKDAAVCLFVFDCIYYNGEILTDKPLKHRKEILRQNMTEIKNHIVFSETQEIYDSEKLKQMIAMVLEQGLEGLVLKGIYSIYEPGKRHWLKVKKDYLFEGAMADSADLIVLGAWYGTGKKGGMMSVFLMGCYDPYTQKFYTVTKVHTGHDDETLERLQTELDMVKINCDPARVPSWLECTKTMIPDFVARDPKLQPVWEISGAEFTRHEVHTADGISIRFPRVTRIRNDKTWESATNLQELQELFKKSKEGFDVSLLLKNAQSTESCRKRSAENTNDSPIKKNKSKRIQSVEQNNLLGFVSKDNMQKNSEFPALSKPEKAKIDVAIKNPLPDYFQGIKLILGKAIKRNYTWLRYFVAFGGNILEPEKWKEATHMLHVTDSSDRLLPPEVNIVHVTVEWLKDSLLKRDPQNPALYPVYLEQDWKVCSQADEFCKSFL